MKNKDGVLGEGLLMIYRLVLIAFIALIVLGLSAVYYDYYLDVRDAEAIIIARAAVNCIAPEGVIDISKYEGYEKKILEYCGYESEELERVYVDLKIYTGGKDFVEFEQGDSGRKWIYDLFRYNKGATEKIAKYLPGHFSTEGEGAGYRIFGILFSEDDKLVPASIKMEVFVNHEF